MIETYYRIQSMILILLCITGQSGVFSGSSGRLTAAGTIFGEIKDQNDARIRGATVIFESRGKESRVITGEDGTYQTLLPPGIYRASVAMNGFCPIMRALFKVEEGKVVRLDFTLHVCAIVHSYHLKKDKILGESDTYEYPFKEERVFPEPASTIAPGELIIQFGDKAVEDDAVEYGGFVIDGRPQRVVATYNLLTIYADRIRFSKTYRRFEAKGDVLMDDGNRKTYASKIIMEIKENMYAVTDLEILKR